MVRVCRQICAADEGVNSGLVTYRSTRGLNRPRCQRGWVIKWFKHMSTSHTDERLAELIASEGLEGYGFWWILLEVIANLMEKDSNKCCASYSLAQWGRLLYCHHNRVGKYLGKLEVIGLVTLEYDSSNSVGKIRVIVPNLLKYRDEYSKKSGQTPDKLRTNSGAKNKNKEVDADKEKTSSSSGDDAFEKFWSAYPRRVGKGAAEKAWRKISNPADTVEKILAALEWQTESDQWTKNNGEYIPHPATYLNQRRWEDEPKEEPQPFIIPALRGCK